MVPSVTTTPQNATETAVHEFCAEASALRLPPGQWPGILPTTLGNGQPFVRSHARRYPSGELCGVVYRQGNGCITLTIWND